MATLTKKQRDALPESDFGDPQRRLFPITDQNDVDSAARLIGKAKNPEAVKKRIIAIAKRKGLKVPDAWQKVNNSAFSLGATISFEDDFVIRTGKLWEADWYEDKQFGMTPEELPDLVDTFTPVPLVDTHWPSVFNGLMAGAETVGVSIDENDASSLLHVTKVPKWLNEVLPDDVPVSAQFDPETKRLIHVALVPDPRVADAALKAGFAQFAKRHDTPHGQMAMQELHDSAARAGAVCKAPTANMASRHEASAVQQIHDIAAAHGATCASGSKPSWFSNSKERAMGFKDTVKAWFNAGMPDDFEPGQPAPPQPQPVPAPPPAPQPDPETAALRERVAAFEKREEERIVAEAAAFAQGEVAAERVLPADQDAVRDEYLQAAKDDAERGPVTFASGTTLRRTARVREFYAARPPHGLTRERLSNGAEPGTVLFNQQMTPAAGAAGAEKPADPEAVKALLNLTPLGRSAQNGTQHN